MVEEPGGDKLEERGVRGERRRSGFHSDPARADYGKGVVLSLLSPREGSF